MYFEVVVVVVTALSFWIRFVGTTRVRGSLTFVASFFFENVAISKTYRANCIFSTGGILSRTKERDASTFCIQLFLSTISQHHPIMSDVNTMQTDKLTWNKNIDCHSQVTQVQGMHQDTAEHLRLHQKTYHQPL